MINSKKIFSLIAIVIFLIGSIQYGIPVLRACPTAPTGPLTNCGGGVPFSWLYNNDPAFQTTACVQIPGALCSTQASNYWYNQSGIFPLGGGCDGVSGTASQFAQNGNLIVNSYSIPGCAEASQWYYKLGAWSPINLPFSNYLNYQFGGSYTVTQYNRNGCDPGAITGGYRAGCDEVSIVLIVNFQSGVGPNGFSKLAMEIAWGRDINCGIFDCPKDTWTARTIDSTYVYNYVYNIGPPPIGVLNSFVISQSDFTSLMAKALCGPTDFFGNCQWNLPLSGRINYVRMESMETMNGAYGSTTWSSFNLGCQCQVGTTGGNY